MGPAPLEIRLVPRPCDSGSELLGSRLRVRIGVLALLVPNVLLLAGQPNVACTRASGAPSFACELRWTQEMVADVEVVVVRLRPAAAAGLAPTVVPSLASSTSQ